jgi:Guanosine polyphosphate pyrophosphohydrolases/synthetases
MQIHRANCKRAITLMSHYGNNIVQAKWQPKGGITFLAGIKITAVDTMGLLNRITNLISVEMKLNLHSLQMESSRELVDSIASIFVHNTKELERLMERLLKIEGVKKVTRIERIAEA